MSEPVKAPYGDRMWSAINNFLPALLLTLLAFAVPMTLPAQEKTSVTVIATEQSGDLKISGNSKVSLRFQGISLPPNAEVTQARLSLVSITRVSAALNITVKVRPTWQPEVQGFGVKNLEARFTGRAYVSAQEKSPFLKGISTVAGGGAGRGGEFWLDLTSSTASGATSEWYSTTSGDSKYRPRLIVEYKLNDRPPVTQSDGLPAVQSQKEFLPSPLPFSYTTRKFPGAYSYTPAFYKNLVYIITDNQGKKLLLALDSLGNQVAQMPLDGETPPGQHLLVSQSGRLYIVGNNQILYIDLDPNNPASLPAGPTKVKQVEKLNPTVPPSVGSNGNLYFVSGQEIYGFNPYLQELWKVNTATVHTSRMTVDPSGEFVYLVAEREGLVTINAQTGDNCSTGFKTAEDANAVLYAPVVIRYPGDSTGNGAADKIYIAANAGNEGMLQLFDNFNDTKAELECADKIRVGLNWPPLKGLWSQPIPDQMSVGKPGDANPDKKIYAVMVDKQSDKWQGSLEEIGWLNNASRRAVCAAYKTGTNECENDHFEVGDKSYLVNGGNLTSDNANRFVWNGSGQPAYTHWVFPPHFQAF